MENSLIDWLLEGEPWIEYRTRIDLLEQSGNHPDVVNAFNLMVDDPQIKDLVEEVLGWPGPVLKSHKKAGHLLHKLGFLSRIGLTHRVEGISEIVEKILDQRSPEGPFQIVMNISPSYGGSGEDKLVWMICDAPLVAAALVELGFGEDERILKGMDHLVKFQRENGWPCTVTPDLGKFRGPGRKGDPCPYANLLMLRLLSKFPERHLDPEVKIGVETILTLWEKKKETKPYLFAMGTDFCKLKAPMVWYDILYVTDVLTRFEWSLEDERLDQMIEILRSKSIEDGRFQAESMWMDWKTWEFGQKKVPSRWITFLVQRIFKRVDE